jgi:hypothetical protein
MVRTSADHGFAIRLEEIVSEFPSRAALAKKANLPPSSLQSYLEGAEPTRPALVALARAANVSLEWLADKRGYKEPRPQIPDGYAIIPIYDIRKSGGYVYPMIMGEIASWICLKLDLFSYPRMQPDKLFVVEALGSQAPQIADRDLLVVDSSWRPSLVDPNPIILVAGNYLVSRQAKLSVREVIGVHDDVVEFVVTGAPRRKEAFRLGEEGFTVHGRIIWYGRSLSIADAIKTDDTRRVSRRRKAR